MDTGLGNLIHGVRGGFVRSWKCETRHMLRDCRCRAGGNVCFRLRPFNGRTRISTMPIGDFRSGITMLRFTYRRRTLRTHLSGKCALGHDCGDCSVRKTTQNMTMLGTGNTGGGTSQLATDSYVDLQHGWPFHTSVVAAKDLLCVSH